MATIELRRLNGFIDAFRSWIILVDDEKIGAIKRNRTEQFHVDQGVHKIQLKIAWCRSNIIEVDTSGDEHIVLTCRPKYTLLSGFFMWPLATAETIVTPDQRIILEKV